MGTTGTGYFDVLTITFLAIVGVAVIGRMIVEIAKRRNRRSAILCLAKTLNLEYLDESIPKDVRLPTIPGWRSGKVENLLWGRFQGHMVVVFDAYLERGRKSGRNTIIGIEVNGKTYLQSRTSRISDSWVFSADPQGLIPVDGLHEALTRSLLADGASSS